MNICYCHPHAKGNKNCHWSFVCWACWVMTVALESFKAVVVIGTTGNTVSLSHSIILHKAFNRHGVQSEYRTFYNIHVLCICKKKKKKPLWFALAPYMKNDTSIETSAVRNCFVSICSSHTDSDLHCHQNPLSLLATYLLMCWKDTSLSNGQK